MNEQLSCIVEKIISTIDKINSTNCSKCSVCREGRKWIKEIINKRANTDSDYIKYHNFLIEMGYYIFELSSCNNGQELGKLIIDQLSKNDIDYFYHLETGECRGGLYNKIQN